MQDQPNNFAENSGQNAQDEGPTCVLINLVNPTSRNHEIAALAIAAIMLAGGLIFPPTYPFNLIVFVLPCLVCGWPIIKKAGLDMWRKRFLSQYVLISAATVILLAFGLLPIALTLMLGYQAGRFFSKSS